MLWYIDLPIALVRKGSKILFLERECLFYPFSLPSMFEKRHVTLLSRDSILSLYYPLENSLLRLFSLHLSRNGISYSVSLCQSKDENLERQDVSSLLPSSNTHGRKHGAVCVMCVFKRMKERFLWSPLSFFSWKRSDTKAVAFMLKFFDI